MSRMMRGWTMVLAGAMALSAAACGGSPAGTAPGEIAADASQVTYDMNMKMTEEGVLKADLFADTASTPVGDTRTQLKNVRLTFFNPGKPPGKLTSREGEYDQVSGMMIARRDVVLIIPGEKGMRTIKSEELHWDQKGDRIWSDRPTSIEEGGQTLYTDGFTSNSAFTNVTGKNARTSDVQVGEGGIRF